MKRSSPYSVNTQALPPQAAVDRLLQSAERERAVLDYPRDPWVIPRIADDGTEILNVLVIGAGQAGISVLANLMREQVSGILAIDAAAAGEEGPWKTVARMNVLRTPKYLVGAEAGIPSLAFQSWYRARHGDIAWDILEQIPRGEWHAYLSWLRDAYHLPIRNGVRLERIVPSGRYLLAELSSERGRETLLARKIVLATGVDGGGGWFTPSHISNLPKALWAHTSEDIDFPALKGKRVAVLGAGASAMDNAAMALEAGAALVHQFCRRDTLQAIQPLKWMGFSGFMRHFGDMDDAWRWRFMSYGLGLREPFTKDAWSRVSCMRNYAFRLGEPCDDVTSFEGAVHIVTKAGSEEFDFIVAGTGVSVDHRLRPELSVFADNIAAWSDRFEPPEGERDDRLSQFPYLNPDFSYAERKPGSCSALANIHCFNSAATLSLGPSGAAIRPLKYAVPRLVNGLTRSLFEEDLPEFWKQFQDFRETEFDEYPFYLNDV